MRNEDEARYEEEARNEDDEKNHAKKRKARSHARTLPTFCGAGLSGLRSPPSAPSAQRGYQPEVAPSGCQPEEGPAAPPGAQPADDAP